MSSALLICIGFYQIYSCSMEMKSDYGHCLSYQEKYTMAESNFMRADLPHPTIHDLLTAK